MFFLITQKRDAAFRNDLTGVAEWRSKAGTSKTQACSAVTWVCQYTCCGGFARYAQLAAESGHLQRHSGQLLLQEVTKCAAAGHGRDKASAVPFWSQLQWDRKQLSSVVRNKKCHNTAVGVGADWRWQQRFASWRGKLRRINAPVRIGAHYDLFNFYKSSSARQEKTRPVAILSTTLQPYNRFHLNATCAVHARTHMGASCVKGKLTYINLGLFCLCLPADVPEIVSAVSEPCLEDLAVWRNREEGKGKGTVVGIEVVLLRVCPKRPQKSKMMGSCRWSGWLALVSDESSGCSHSAAPLRQ